MLLNQFWVENWQKSKGCMLLKTIFLVFMHPRLKIAIFGKNCYFLVIIKNLGFSVHLQFQTTFCTFLNMRFKILSISGASEFKIGPLQLLFKQLYHNMQMSMLTCPCALIRGRSKYFFSFFYVFFFETISKKTLNNDWTTL